MCMQNIISCRSKESARGFQASNSAAAVFKEDSIASTRASFACSTFCSRSPKRFSHLASWATNCFSIDSVKRFCISSRTTLRAGSMAPWQCWRRVKWSCGNSRVGESDTRLIGIELGGEESKKNWEELELGLTRNWKLSCCSLLFYTMAGRVACL